MKVKSDLTELWLDEGTLRFGMGRQGVDWNWNQTYVPRMETADGIIRFADAASIEHEIVKNGIGEGIRSTYKGFVKDGKEVPYAFETYVWVEDTTKDIFFEWIPLCEEGLEIQKLYWPGEMEFEQPDEKWYTLVNTQQGTMIPNTWDQEFEGPVFDGYYLTAGGYMPWYAQIKDRDGYIAISTTPWNGGYSVDHPANGPYTHVGNWFEPNLGKMDYRRIVRYTLLSDCDYNDMCKTYRTYVKEQGRLRTLGEKAVQVPSVDRLIGCSFIHTGIKTSVREDSDFFDPEKPTINNSLTTFAQREEEIRKIHETGIKDVYLHLDGWAEPGYDNCHPDYGPVCEEAGGRDGMKSLVDTMHEFGYLFGIHDQYRDYYLAAPSFDEDYACRLTDGSIPTHQRWAGGPQSFLCGSQAPYYVRRNFDRLEKDGIELDCAYLDVFTCNEGDECNNPRHRVSRKECYEARANCFNYLMSRGILPSSEEVSDWCVPSMVFSHYAPYDFMLREPGEPKLGIPVPLFSLVYHDCLITPWMMDKVDEHDDYMLYALLNGGAPYLRRDGAYPNFDGSFETKITFTLEESVERCKVVADLHKKVAKCEMVRHEMVGGDAMVQKAVYSDGTEVTVDFREQTYQIKSA